MNNFDKQYLTLYDLDNGWFDYDQGTRYDPEKLDEFKKLYDKYYKAKEPFLYPGFDHILNLEWSLPSVENEFTGLIVDINVNTLDSELFYYKENSEDTLASFDLNSKFNLSDENGWDIFNNIINGIYNNE